MIGIAFNHQLTSGAVRQGRSGALGSDLRNHCAGIRGRHRGHAFGIGGAWSALFAGSARVLTACLVLAMSLPVSADCTSVREKCDTDLDRVNDYNYQLAVCQSGRWYFCMHNGPRSPHHLTARSDEVEFFWAVPASEQHEFIYASTSYVNGQSLSVARSATYKSHKLFHVFAPFRNVDEYITGDPGLVRQHFREYHADRERSSVSLQRRRLGRPVVELLSEWHDTELWGRLKSYSLVRTALAQSENPPLLAAERLIRLTEKRPKASWARFTSRVKYGERLRIVLAYSGSDPKRTWSFNFEVSRTTSKLPRRRASNDDR